MCVYDPGLDDWQLNVWTTPLKNIMCEVKWKFCLWCKICDGPFRHSSHPFMIESCSDEHSCVNQPYFSFITRKKGNEMILYSPRFPQPCDKGTCSWEGPLLDLWERWQESFCFFAEGFMPGLMSQLAELLKWILFTLFTWYLPKSAINKKTHLSSSPGKRKNWGSTTAVIFILVAKQVRKIDKINHTN